jgi:hypothetical protein
MTTHPGTRRPQPRRLLAATAALALLAITGACASGGGDSSSADVSTSEVAPAAAADEAAAAEAPQEESGALDRSALADSASSFTVASGGGNAESTGRGGNAPAQQAVTDGRSLIKTGNVALRSDDVPAARFDVGKVLDAHGGEVAEETTQADDDGDIERVRLVARVPVDEFDATMSDVEGVAELIDVSTKTEDVSTEVIDTEVRVELQRRSIDRISILLDSAADLRDIVSIERELARREADLGSLEKRQAFLADQTTMATITLSIEPPPERKAQTAPEEDEDGFLAGLSSGWNALEGVTTGLLTAGGALLPFALVLLVLAVPGRLLARRFLPRTTPSAPAGDVPPVTA